MYLDNVPGDVKRGDVVLIEDGVHHRVESNEEGLYFVCVFDGNRNH
jgi:mannose-6-phosphate isomerase-like protein (cupin superfamily)